MLKCPMFKAEGERPAPGVGITEDVTKTTDS
jgi:hypothetical protein